MAGVVTVIVLFHLSRALMMRAQPPFPPPDLVHRGTAVFDTRLASQPVLLAVAVSPRGRIAVLDSRAGVVHLFSPGGTWQCQTPNVFPDGSRLKHPLGLAFGPDEALFLADTGNQRVVQFSSEGLIKTLGKAGITPGEFVLPSALVCGEAELFVLDSALCRIQQFARDGTFLAKTGRKGTFPGAFQIPVSLVRDPEADLVAVDVRQSSLIRFDSQLGFGGQRRVGGSPRAFAASRVAFAGDGLTFVLSKQTQEVVVFFQETAIAVLTPSSLRLENAWWTDLAGQGNFLYLLDGKGRKVDFFELR